jgi:ATP-dependent Clp protease adaptor protein ClpS
MSGQRFPIQNSGEKYPEIGSPEGTTLLEPDIQTKEPKLYKVILLNDDYTPMDFVVLVLKKYFGKNEDQAHQIMLDVHRKGAGVAGVFTLEVAEMRCMQCNQFARTNRHPLKSTLEPES